LQAFPLDGRIVLREPADDEDGLAGTPSANSAGTARKIGPSGSVAARINGVSRPLPEAMERGDIGSLAIGSKRCRSDHSDARPWRHGGR